MITKTNPFIEGPSEFKAEGGVYKIGKADCALHMKQNTQLYRKGSKRRLWRMGRINPRENNKKDKKGKK